MVVVSPSSATNHGIFLHNNKFGTRYLNGGSLPTRSILHQMGGIRCRNGSLHTDTLCIATA